MLQKGKPPEVFNAVAFHLYSLFLKEPLIWQTLPYLNDGQKNDFEFPQHLIQWHKAVPANLKKYVEMVADHMGFPIPGTVGAKAVAAKPLSVD